MSVWRRFHGHGFPSMVTSNVAGRNPVFRSTGDADHFLQTLLDVKTETRSLLIAFVVMPDHFHLVVQPPMDARLSRVMQLIKGRFAYEHHKITNQTGPFWQDRYHESALRSEKALWSAVEYVENNPVAGGLVTSREAYQWSSAAHPELVDRDWLSG